MVYVCVMQGLCSVSTSHPPFSSETRTLSQFAPDAHTPHIATPLHVSLASLEPRVQGSRGPGDIRERVRRKPLPAIPCPIDPSADLCPYDHS